MTRPLYDAVYVVVNARGEPAYVGDKGAPIYSRKYDAVRKCPRDGRVLKFKLDDAEAVHEGSQR
ncbi:hypothetical protein [Burkholderia pseudomallei]|uniref:hypothetical protein n=1 Tax=Burkholderia pseudomallei TaxID=28450 RepID=UPI000537FAEE|nr:hypothetical protein [Burkholderia pseudomallei]KGW51930.1 hypothetical protein Y049_505 [Burkholderia pseudomallei MSHR684]